jgi:hypothetical protein
VPAPYRSRPLPRIHDGRLVREAQIVVR